MKDEKKIENRDEFCLPAVDHGHRNTSEVRRTKTVISEQPEQHSLNCLENKPKGSPHSPKLQPAGVKELSMFCLAFQRYAKISVVPTQDAEVAKNGMAKGKQLRAQFHLLAGPKQKMLLSSTSSLSFRGIICHTQ